jgi:predicted phosphodiesterase
MRVAVFSDVHGNLTALDAVLSDIQGKNVDQIIFAGDLCLLGPRPGECLRRIREANIISIYGNTDEWLLESQVPPQRLAALAGWTLAQLSPDEQSWLDALPFSKRISPINDVLDDLLVVHANPLDVNQIIFPPEQEQMTRYGIVRQTDEELGELVHGVEARLMAYGHLHIPGERVWEQLRLVNISSVSIPGDGDERAKYGIFSWQDDNWSFERFFVGYDMEKEIDAYRKAQPPGWEKIIDTIQSDGFFPQRV